MHADRPCAECGSLTWNDQKFCSEGCEWQAEHMGAITEGHPAFHILHNGNLEFPKPSRTEGGPGQPLPWFLAGLIACTTGATWNIMGDGSALYGTAWGIAVGALLLLTTIYSMEEQPVEIAGVPK